MRSNVLSLLPIKRSQRLSWPALHGTVRKRGATGKFLASSHAHAHARGAEITRLACFFSSELMSESQLDAAMAEMDDDNSGEVQDPVLSSYRGRSPPEPVS